MKSNLSALFDKAKKVTLVSVPAEPEPEPEPEPESVDQPIEQDTNEKPKKKAK